jgi:hypothetical protein
VARTVDVAERGVVAGVLEHCPDRKSPKGLLSALRAQKQKQNKKNPL